MILSTRSRSTHRARAICVRALLLALAFSAVFATRPTANAQSSPSREAGPSRAAPEAASDVTERGIARAKREMVSAANPLAVEAGLAMLARGGSAADAAIAVQLVLNLVEPQSSGIGGGAFALYWRASDKVLYTLDGRETAPAAAVPERFIVDGKPMAFGDAISSPLSVGVPGLVRMLADLHKREGRLPWSDLFAPAITLATEGFEISPRLHGLLTWMRADRFSDDRARTYFFEADGSPKPVGTRLTNLAFAATLSDLAKGGAQAFYGGTISAKIIERLRDNPAAAVTTHARAVLAQSDFVAYRSVERPPVCTTYRGYRVCGMGPPSSGAITVAQTLALIEPYAIGRSRGDALRPAAVHIIAEAQKLAFADRGRYLADPDHVRVPMTLLDRAYLANRSKLIHPGRAATSVKPGIPPGVNPRTRGADGSVESAGTSHISIVDADGNAVSLTSSIESAFGNRTMVGGFLLNNQLTDFSFRPIDADGQPIANRVGPGKRPRSSMAPTVIFAPDGNLFAVLGSPGGSRIILYVTKAIVSLIDWQLDAQEAAALTNFGSRGRGFEIESAPTPDRLRALYKAFADRLFADQSAPSPIPIIRPLDMKAYNHELRPARMTSGLQIIVRRSEGLEGGSDPRREGVSRGR